MIYLKILVTSALAMVVGGAMMAASDELESEVAGLLGGLIAFLGMVVFFATSIAWIWSL